MAKFETVLAIVQETFPFVKSRQFRNHESWVWEFWLNHYEAIIEPIETDMWRMTPQIPEDETFTHAAIPYLHITSDDVYRIIPINTVDLQNSVSIADGIIRDLNRTKKVKRENE